MQEKNCYNKDLLFMHSALQDCERFRLTAFLFQSIFIDSIARLSINIIERFNTFYVRHTILSYYLKLLKKRLFEYNLELKPQFGG